MVHMKLFLWFYTTEASEKMLNFETYTYKSEIIHNSCFKMWHTLIKPSILFSPSHVQTCGHLHMHIIPKHTYLHLNKIIQYHQNKSSTTTLHSGVTIHNYKYRIVYKHNIHIELYLIWCQSLNTVIWATKWESFKITVRWWVILITISTNTRFFGNYHCQLMWLCVKWYIAH